MPSAEAISEVVKELLAGAAGGMAGLAVGYPFDTIKTYQQVSTQKRSMWKTAVFITKTKGIAKGLFRGMAVPLYTNGAIFAVFFSSYTATLNWFTRRDGRAQKNPGKHPEDISTYGEVFIGGCVGGAAQTIVAGPVELIKVQMQIGKEAKASGVGTFKKLMRVRGFRGLGMGMGATLLRDVHSHGVYTVYYKMYLDYICKNDSLQAVTPYCMFAAGGVAGVLFWWSCVPMDVVKSRLQADSMENPKYKNSLDCFRKIVKTEGAFMPFWGGFGAITLRAFPSNGAIFLVYSGVRDLYDYVGSLLFKKE